MTVDEYKKQNTLHVELPSGLAFDCRAPSGLVVARFYERVRNLDLAKQALEFYGIMLQEFESCFPDGLKLEDFTTEDYAALSGIALPFFSKSPFPFPSGSRANSENDTSEQGSGLTTT
jgi:hypothetical protein